MFRYSTAILFLFVSHIAYNQTIERMHVDSLLSSKYSDNELHGSVLIALGDSIHYNQGFGYANIEWEQLNNQDTKFRIGSLTKQFTAALILKLEEEGYLELSHTISKYLSDFPVEIGNRVTIHHLLSNTSGIKDLTEIPNFWTDSVRIHYQHQKLINNLCARGLEFEPGTKFKYSNSGYILLGAIIERATGKKLDSILDKVIVEPLGLKNTGIEHSGMILKKRATGYFFNNGNYTRAPYVYIENAFTAGGMYSTALDLFNWHKALATEKFLSESSINKMFREYQGPYGYGWYVKKLFTRNITKQIHYHTGQIHGFHHIVVSVPEDQLFFVILNNVNTTPIIEIRDSLLKTIYNDENLKIID